MGTVTAEECYNNDWVVFKKLFKGLGTKVWSGHPLQAEKDSGELVYIDSQFDYIMELAHTEFTTPVTKIEYYILTK